MNRAPEVSAWATHVVQLRAARAFFRACHQADLPALPVKGIVTAHTLYDDPASRPLRDVDIRIRPDDYARLGDVARAEGWRFAEVKRAYQNYVLEVEGVEVDVECHVGPPHTCSLRVADMIARARPGNVLGFAAPIPDPIDHAVLLVVNAFKDKLALARDGALEDLVRLPSLADFDGPAIAERLRAAGAATLGWIVSDYLARERDSAGWRAVRDALEPLRRPVYERLLRWSRARPDGVASIVLARASSDEPFERVRALATMARWAAERRSS